MQSHCPPILHHNLTSCGHDEGVNENAPNGPHIDRSGLVVQPTRFRCTSAGKSPVSPNSKDVLRSSLALAALSIRKAINALRVDGMAVQTLQQSAFRMLQAPEPVQEEPDALIANWGQLGDDKIDFGGGSLGLTGICPIAP